MKAWNVYLNNRIIDTVFFMGNCDRWYIRNSLIDHDGYDIRILVRENRRLTQSLA